jgi:predicted transposase YbfD/YdcC
MALAQQKAAGRNETAGALEVLDLLSLEGCIVTADALHCHRAFAMAVRERGGDYVLAIKANRGRLFTAVTQQFVRSGKRSIAEQIDRFSHDRHEARRATIMRNTSLAALYGFPGAAAVGRITSRRRLRRGQRADVPIVRHYLLSKYMSPKRLLHVTRSHWGIENQLHWVLDVHFAEDRNRARKDNAPENLAILRRLALNILRTHPELLKEMQHKFGTAIIFISHDIAVVHSFADTILVLYRGQIVDSGTVADLFSGPLKWTPELGPGIGGVKV